MPSELRRITFSSAELVDALTGYDRHAGQKLTCGAIVGWSIETQPAVRMNVDLAVYGDSGSLSVALDSDYVGAALVMYCLANTIPIPMNSQRYLMKVGERLALGIAMNEAIEEAGTPLPDFFRLDTIGSQPRFA